jgi:hypothetical protein
MEMGIGRKSHTQIEGQYVLVRGCVERNGDALRNDSDGWINNQGTAHPGLDTSDDYHSST